MGLRDLELYKKEKGGKWEQVWLAEVDLPPVDLVPFIHGTQSPPPGRPCQGRADKRSRESNGSPGGVNPKALRRESND